MIFDTHTHYDDKEFDHDRELVLADLKNHNIGTVVNVSSSLASIKTTLDLTKKYDFIYGTVGVHPSETGELTEESFAYLQEQAKQEKIVAIGEIGLDYHWKEPDKAIQKTWFLRQLSLAKELDMPFIIHSRDAAEDTFNMIKSEYSNGQNGVIHCFSYSKEIAKKYLTMGFYLGIGGVVTFQNSKKLKEVVEYMPLSQLLLETDCPYLAPVPYRGKRNFSGYLSYVIEEIARLKNISIETVMETTTGNAKKFYRL